VSKHSPEILTGIGTAGLITTTVLAVKATPKALKLIEEAKEEQNIDKLTAVDTVKTTWKCYIPAAATCIASVACIIGASSVSVRRNATLAAAYKLSESAFTEYREKVRETIGEKKEETVREALDKDRIEKNPVSKNEVIITGKGTTLCYDHHSGRYFESDIDRIKRAENSLNKEMIHDISGYVSLNDLYDEIGLERTPLGESMGWNTEKGLIDIHFGSQLTEDGRPCIVLDHINPPVYGYDKFY
jgi:hypothetical protein